MTGEGLEPAEAKAALELERANDRLMKKLNGTSDTLCEHGRSIGNESSGKLDRKLHVNTQRVDSE